MFRFEELNVYKESLEFVDLVYALTDRWPKEEKFSLIDQFRRAAISITPNITEGTSRKLPDFRHFLDLARGSCYECVAIITIAKRRGYLDQTRYAQFYERLDKISRMISALKNSLR